MIKRFLAGVALFSAAVPAVAYIEIPYPLGRLLAESSVVAVMRVEKVDREKNLILYRKVQDLKGQQPGEVIRHNIGRAGFHEREWKTIMEWAEPGKLAVFLHNGGASETCIDGYWYQAYAGGEWWNMSHAEPYLLRTFAGRPEKLAMAIGEILAGREVIVPAMIDGDKNSLQLRTAKIQRMRASLKLQDYNAQRDFVGWGNEDFRRLAGMPGFTHSAGLTRVDPGARGIAAADIDGDGDPDFCLFGESKTALIKNEGAALSEIALPYAGPARAAAWADHDGDGKPDLLLAAPGGPRLLTNAGDVFRDDSARLPSLPYATVTAAAWIDYDGDKKPDVLLANGFLGLRLFRNAAAGAPAGPAVPQLGPWHLAGPFDFAGGAGFDRAYPPEHAVDLAATCAGKANEKVAWQKRDFPDGQVNSLALFKPEHNVDCVAYVTREIEVASATDLPVSLGSDDTLCVWLNGQKLLAENVMRAAAPDQHLVTLKLRPGKNRLLLKIGQGAGEFAFYFAARQPQPGTGALFEDITAKAGLGPTGLGGSLRGDHLALADVNGDGRTDFLYGGILALATAQAYVESRESGIVYAAGGTAPVFGDFDRDGDADLFVPQADRSKLLRNDGRGRFTDVTAVAGDLAAGVGGAAGAAWVDLTRQGRPDLVVGCLGGPNRVFRNAGNGKFTEVTEKLGFTQRVFNSRAIAGVDLNKDGVADLVLNNEGQEPVALLGDPQRTGMLGPPGLAAPRTLLASIGPATLAAALLLRSPADWPTHRGNAARTGNADGAEGPARPKVLWAHLSQEHFIAAPAVAGDRLLVSGLGAFNTAALHAVALEAGAAPRCVWSRPPPFLKQPTVCAAAVSGGRAVLGDGMHQTDGASLLGVRPADGRLLWKLDVPGTLVHIEGTPTIAGGRLFVGAGNGGVLCVDLERLTLDGRDVTAAEAERALEARWKELAARYEIEKKKDPDFAIPPSEDALPKPAPRLIWKRGHDGWHVDAPTAVAGERVLVLSAFLDHEKLGDRALYCLNAADGATLWKLPLRLNGWSGVTVAGDVVLVGCSTIRFDVKELAAARGEVVAARLADGQELWRRELPAGVLGSVAAAGEAAIVADTAGRVQALETATGKTRWSAEAGAGFFAGAALGPGVAYLADLKGRVHALKLADGKAVWTLDLATDPAVRAPGMVYGAPVLAGGRLFVGTCNVEGPNAGNPTALVCIGEAK